MIKLLNGVRQHMQPICVHKISIQSSKPSHGYPIIRLPREYQELAGHKAKIFQTSHQGKLVKRKPFASSTKVFFDFVKALNNHNI